MNEVAINSESLQDLSATSYTLGVLESAILSCKDKIPNANDKQRAKLIRRVEVLTDCVSHIYSRYSYLADKDEYEKIITALKDVSKYIDKYESNSEEHIKI